MPADRVRRVLLSIRSQRLRRVLFRINRNGNEFHVEVRSIHVLERFQVFRHDGADAAAGGEKKRRDPDLVVEPDGIKGLSLRVDQPEWPHPAVDWQKSFRGGLKKYRSYSDKYG